jgi:Arc/MetJ-type ribon-helix-helix transcriptional regulator
MTITLNPEQEEAIRNAIRSGRVASVEEFIERAIAQLSKPIGTPTANSAAKGTVFEQGLGLFGSPEDAALLDEVISIAYEERRRPSKRNSNL